MKMGGFIDMYIKRLCESLKKNLIGRVYTNKFATTFPFKQS